MGDFSLSQSENWEGNKKYKFYRLRSERKFAQLYFNKSIIRRSPRGSATLWDGTRESDQVRRPPHPHRHRLGGDHRAGQGGGQKKRQITSKTEGSNKKPNLELRFMLLRRWPETDQAGGL